MVGRVVATLFGISAAGAASTLVGSVIGLFIGLDTPIPGWDYTVLAVVSIMSFIAAYRMTAPDAMGWDD
jgi:hypothetical protein